MSGYFCPFCYAKKPASAEPSNWAHCGEVGHAVMFGDCPKCGAELFDSDPSSPGSCVVCGHFSRNNHGRRRWT
jgi:hypothetical protein